jgi:hypothetical protein
MTLKGVFSADMMPEVVGFQEDLKKTRIARHVPSIFLLP